MHWLICGNGYACAMLQLPRLRVCARAQNQAMRGGCCRACAVRQFSRVPASKPVSQHAPPHRAAPRRYSGEPARRRGNFNGNKRERNLARCIQSNPNSFLKQASQIVNDQARTKSRILSRDGARVQLTQCERASEGRERAREGETETGREGASEIEGERESERGRGRVCVRTQLSKFSHHTLVSLRITPVRRSAVNSSSSSPCGAQKCDLESNLGLNR